MSNYDILLSPFDINTHKEHFYNYLEVIIFPDGTVEYAIPSHQEKLIRICMQKLGIINKKEFIYLCPEEYYLDYMTWLHMISGCISVWDFMYQGTCNDAQIAKLQELKDAGLYRGEI